MATTLTLDVDSARLIRNDEIIQSQGGSQVVPAGGIILHLENGMQLGFDRAYFDALFPDADLGTLYTESEANTGDWPPLPGPADIPTTDLQTRSNARDAAALIEGAKDQAKAEQELPGDLTPYPAEDIEPKPGESTDEPPVESKPAPKKETTKA